MCRNTSIFDWPIVALTYFIAVSNSAAGRLKLVIASVNAAITMPSSLTVVPAMSRQATEIRCWLMAGTSPRRSRANRSCRARPGR